MMMHNAKRKNIKCKNSTKHIVVCNRIVKRGIPRGTQSIVLGATNAGEHRVRRNQNASFHSFAARRDLREVSLFTRTSYARGKKATENAPPDAHKKRETTNTYLRTCIVGISNTDFIPGTPRIVASVIASSFASRSSFELFSFGVIKVVRVFFSSLFFFSFFFALFLFVTSDPASFVGVISRHL